MSLFSFGPFEQLIISCRYLAELPVGVRAFLLLVGGVLRNVGHVTLLPHPAQRTVSSRDISSYQKNVSLSIVTVEQQVNSSSSFY
jgi:hypothetical protein